MALLNQNNKEIRALRRAKSMVKDNPDFSKVGGLNHHLKTLREIIIFPLLHGNVFNHFKIKPPRGVLFYGPPGTGKTLVAGALAAEINREGIGKVSFFQRKGADILDKWVGESEKNLRMLFEKATKSRPSIIFFDELDGLAPTRSEKNDHIHSSIVATLLALMDGLDSKPGVIVIGATNRIEAIDPALRRAGRFDKELYFPLPGVEARKEIIQVHTVSWKYKPSPKFVAHLGDLTAGFCGADIQALCSEAVLCCLRRLYPKIDSKGFNKRIEAESMKVEECDFLDARLNMAPSSLKQSHKLRDLNPIIKPLLQREQNRILGYIQLLWPHFLQEGYRYIIGDKRYAGRILLIGSNQQGLSTHLLPSILKQMEHLPAFIYDTRIFDRVKTTFVNVQMNFPAIILLSRVDEWWNYIDDCDQHSIVSTLEDIHAGLPILTIASCKKDIPARLHNFFYNNSTLEIILEDPNEEERKNFLAPLFFDDKSLSLFKILEYTRKQNRKLIKCEADGDVNETCCNRKKKRSKITEDFDIRDSFVDVGIRKRKRDQSSQALTKRIRVCENKYGPQRSNSTTCLFDIHRQIKHEKGDDEQTCEFDRFTPLQSLRNKQQFTRVLSDLLNQRSVSCKDCSSSGQLEMISYDDVKIESNKETALKPMASSSVTEDSERQIYSLWNHASLMTSRDMAVAQLELLYDVIYACIGIHQYSFDAAVVHLENVLHKIENSYQISPSDSCLQCS